MADAKIATTTLKPCPFCGLPPKMHETTIGNMDFWVNYCKNNVCGVSPTSKYRRLRREAIEAWNRRFSDGK